MLKFASDASSPLTEGDSVIHSAEVLSALESDSEVLKVQCSVMSVIVTVNTPFDLPRSPG